MKLRLRTRTSSVAVVATAGVIGALLAAGPVGATTPVAPPPTTTTTTPQQPAGTVRPNPAAPASPRPTPSPTPSSPAATTPNPSPKPTVPPRLGASAQPNSAPGDPNCDFYAQTGYSVCGAIRDHYNALGGPNSFLGYPTSDEITNPDGIGKRNTFQNANGHIYWSPATGAQEIGGSIFDKWGTFGYETGALGYPTSDEITNPDGIGKRNSFQFSNNHIYFSPATGTNEIGGAIFDHWGTFGYETGALGYPITDELTNPDGVGKRNIFQSVAAIYWSPSTPASEVGGSIFTHWAQLGFEAGVLGYPITDETGTPDGVWAATTTSSKTPATRPASTPRPTDPSISHRAAEHTKYTVRFATNGQASATRRVAWDTPPVTC